VHTPIWLPDCSHLPDRFRLLLFLFLAPLSFCASYSSIAFLVYAQFSSGSQEVYSSGQPSHCTRYYCFPAFRFESIMAFTVHLLLSSARGTGSAGSSPARCCYGSSKDTWKTLWMLYEAGSTSWYAYEPTASLMRNGPINFGPIFFFRPSSLKFFEDNSTLSPTL
jgi:hypothetical protein